MSSTIRRAAPLAALFVTVLLIVATLTVRAEAAQGERPPTPVELVGEPIAIEGTVVVDFPATQTVDGTVDIGNLPATQTVDGTVDIGNLPSTQTVDGSVAVTNLPSVQDVRIVDGGASGTTGGATFRANTTFGPATTSFVVPAGEYLKDLVVLDANDGPSFCVFNFRSVPGDGTSTFSTPRGQELQANPIHLSTGFPGPLEVVVACGTNPDTFANGFYTTSTTP